MRRLPIGGAGRDNACMVKMRRRSRVRMGSGGILYLVVSGLILASAIYTQANLLFWGFGLMVGGLVISIGLTAVALRGLQVERLVSSHTAAGESLALRYRVSNRSWLPAFGVVIRENWGRGSRGWKKVGPCATRPVMLGGPPYAWVMHVGPRQATQAQVPCVPRIRGTLRFERIEASTSFPFGVIHKTVVFDQEQEVLVFPHLYRVKRRLLSQLTMASGDGRRPVNRTGGTEEFFGLREYRPGDSLRMVDWKRSARTGDLVAREMTLPSPPKLSLVLDLRETPPDGIGGKGRPDEEAPVSGRVLEERAISLTASLICDAYLRGFRIGLRVIGPSCPDFPMRHNMAHRTRMLESLAALDLTQRASKKQGHDTARGNVVVWAGRGRPFTGGGQGATLLGAAEFDDYVLNPALLAELDALLRRQQGRAANVLLAGDDQWSAALAGSDTVDLDAGVGR